MKLFKSATLGLHIANIFKYSLASIFAHMRLGLPLTIFLFILIMVTCSQKSNPRPFHIDGISLEAPSEPNDGLVMTDISSLGADWISIMPYAYSETENPELIFETITWQWWGEKKEGVEQCIKQAHATGLKVMVKPHIWIGRGEFTGDKDFESAEEWAKWNKSYEEYILLYAEVAERNKAEMLCIGTELKNHVSKQPAFWNELIDKVKEIYTGPLTYAGNWDSYTQFPFWEKLDYIGVDAYFPVCPNPTPTATSTATGWEPWIEELEAISLNKNKKIIFTEYGYRSINHCAQRPWETGGHAQVNMIAQSNALEGLYQSVWQEEWMAGGFLWKWHDPSNRNIDRQKDKFTPQGKQAIEVIKEAYSN